MARAARRTPTTQELAERMSSLEKQMTEMVQTVAGNNTSTVHEMTEIGRALLDRRMN